MRGSLGIVMTVLALLCLAATGAPSAAANRALLSEELLHTELEPAPPKPPPDGQIESACGLAISANILYVADYHHRAVESFALPGGGYLSRIALPGGPFPTTGLNTLDSVCGLALDPPNHLYANEWHQAAVRLKPSEQVFDSGHESTGVAVDLSGNLYVDNRTYVAVYERSGEPLEVGGEPLHIGEGHLSDAYGVAVSPTGDRVYVPDATTNAIEVFEPALDPSLPVAEISHGFTSLVDAAVALDPTTGNLILAESSQPGYEHPQAALLEFATTGAFLGQLACDPVTAEPSGLAFDSSGNLYVTNGNGEGSNVFEYGPYTTEAVPRPSCGAVARAGGRPSAATGPATSPAPAVQAGGSSGSAGARDVVEKEPAATSTTVQRRGVRVSFNSRIRPNRLPRHGSAAVSLGIAVRIAAAAGAPPALRRVSIEFNRAGRLHPGALPACTVAEIQPSTTAAARAACGRSVVGEGSFSADVRLPEQSPFPSVGKVVAFNGRYKGHPAILTHVYGTSPVPTSYTLPFVIGRASGELGTALRASLPEVTSKAAAITSLSLNLGQGVAGGGHNPYLSAACRAPKDLSVAAFPLARGSFVFTGGPSLNATAVASCRVRR